MDKYYPVGYGTVKKSESGTMLFATEEEAREYAVENGINSGCECCPNWNGYIGCSICENLLKGD